MELNTDVAHSARVYDYLLGGKDHYAADREAAEEVVKVAPYMRTSIRASRNFMVRMAHHLAAECGIRQYLDIGTGLPTSPNLHEVVQAVDPSSHVIYVDNDPIVLVHARALLTSTPQGVTDYIDSDLREPRKILAAAAETLDFGEPVGVMLLGILNHFAEDGDAKAVIDTIMDATCPGSHLSISVNTNVINRENMDRAAAAYNEAFGRPPIYMYTPDRLAAHFTGLELVDPGVVSVARWRPTPVESPSDGEPPETDAFVGVARKP